jgi:ferredoxin
LEKGGNVRGNHRFGLRWAHKGGFVNRSETGRFTGSPAAPPALDAEDELSSLRQRATIVRRRLEEIKRRIEGQEVVGPQRVTAIVDQAECTGCALCYEVCPAGAISVDGSAQIDSAKCTACLACVKQCPQGAIAVKYPEE